MVDCKIILRNSLSLSPLLSRWFSCEELSLGAYKPTYNQGCTLLGSVEFSGIAEYIFGSLEFGTRGLSTPGNANMKRTSIRLKLVETRVCEDEDPGVSRISFPEISEINPYATFRAELGAHQPQHDVLKCFEFWISPMITNKIYLYKFLLVKPPGP